MAIGFALWFEARAEDALGEFTAGVESFLHERTPDYNWREDVILASRRRVEYHLNMLSAELLNRAYCEVFEAKDKVAAMAPRCKAAAGQQNCKAVNNGLDYTNRVTNAARENLELTSVRIHSCDGCKWIALITIIAGCAYWDVEFIIRTECDELSAMVGFIGQCIVNDLI